MSVVRWSLVWCVAGAAACGTDPDAFSEQDWAVIQAMRQVDRPPAGSNEFAGDAGVIHFGQQLFYDEGLVPARDDGASLPDGGVGPGSGIACADCHSPRVAFSDGRSSPNVSVGRAALTGRNALPLANVGYYSWFAWDGRSDSAWAQVAFAYQAAGTMQGTPQRMLHRVSEAYAGTYEALFGSPPPDGNEPKYAPCTNPVSLFPCNEPEKSQLKDAYERTLKSIGAWMLELVSLDSPIDRYAAGDSTALSENQKRGLRLFIGKAGCITCHSGPHFTDDDFHALGVAQTGPNVPPVDRGRQEGLERYFSSPWNTGMAPMPSPTDEGKFRTKSLRNVALTGPYFHAGQAATLKDVVWFYNQGGDHAGPNVSPLMVPLGLSDEEQADLVSFLGALTGQAIDPALTCDPSVPANVKPRTQPLAPRCP
jgi:cytochrome c peroxidase